MEYEYDLLVDGITQSQILKYLECKRKFRYSLLRGWKPEGMGQALLFGIVMHECLDRWYSNLEASLDPYTLAVEVCDWYREENQYAKKSLAERQDFDLIEAQVLGVFPAYTLYHKLNDTKITWIRMERAFNVPLKVRLSNGKSIVVPIRGKIDGEIRAGKAKYLVLDHKTKGRVNLGAISNTLLNDFQMNLYTWAANETRTTTNYRYSGCMYNIIKRPQHRFSMGKETLKQYSERIDADLRKRGAEFFLRVEAGIRKKQQDDFVKVLKAIVIEIAEFILNKNGESIDTFTPPCMGPWGQCELLHLCFDGNSKGLRHRTTPFEELA